MSGPNLQESKRIVQGISFRDGVTEIQYVEPYDQSDHIAVVKQLMFDDSVCSDQLDALVSDLEDLVDAVIDVLRDPPMTRPSGR